MFERRRYKVVGVSLQTKYDESLLEADGWFKTKAEAVAWAESKGLNTGPVRNVLHLPKVEAQEEAPARRGPGRPPKNAA